MEKIQALEQIKQKAQELGLTPKEIVEAFLLKDVFDETTSQSLQLKYIVPRTVLPGMYIYADGLISSELIFGRQVKAVVTFVEGNMVYGFCLEEKEMPWGEVYTIEIDDDGDIEYREKYFSVPETTEMQSGKEATQKILEAASKQQRKAYAAQWCHDYIYGGVLPGEAFLPSFYELKKVFPNIDAVNASFDCLKVPLLKGYYYTSNEVYDSDVRVLCMEKVVRDYVDGHRTMLDKALSNKVRSMIQIRL